MTWDKEEAEEVEVLRHHNRAQRSVNRHLRRAVKHFQNHTDELFLELCDSDTEAQIALEKIRTFGGLECDSGDYSFIVDSSVRALQELSAIDQSS